MPSYTREVKVPGKTATELYQIIDGTIEKMFAKASSFAKFDLVRHPERCEFEVKSSMFSANLKCTDGTMKLDGKLSLMAMPFKSKIDEVIDRWLDKTFAR